MADFILAAEPVGSHMDEILTPFKQGVKITILVRDPSDDELDFCMTTDDLGEVAEMVERRRVSGFDG